MALGSNFSPEFADCVTQIVNKSTDVAEDVTVFPRRSNDQDYTLNVGDFVAGLSNFDKDLDFFVSDGNDLYEGINFRYNKELDALYLDVNQIDYEQSTSVSM